MDGIFQIDEHDLPWAEYDSGGEVPIRFKALTADTAGVPPVQYVEYPPRHTDPVHKHSTGEVVVVTSGELWVGETRNGAGSVLFVAKGTDYAFRSGDDGARFFRIVVD